MIIEIIATSVAEAVLAEKYGADRVELIHAFIDGGLSPALELSKQVCNAVSIPVNVMVRPHARSFVYSREDFKQIETEIDYLTSQTQANAIVFGSLNSSGEVNHDDLKRVIKLVEGKCEFTFHRAIDVARAPLEAFRDLQKYGTVITNVLSSGGMPTAYAGLDVLTKMQDIQSLYAGASLLPGSGVTPANAAEIITRLPGVRQLHLGTGVRGINGFLDHKQFDLLRTALGISK